MLNRHLCFYVLVLLGLASTASFAQVAGKSGASDLIVADGGNSAAMVVVSPNAGEWEKRAAADLAKYIEMISGAKPALADTAEAVQAAMAAQGPLLIVGQQALEADPSLREALAKVAKPNPLLRSDAIVVRRANNRVYLAGNTDDAHYYAVAEILNRWGCRWYLPTEIGECIPKHPKLSVGDIDHAYAPPFEVRNYWLSWNGDSTGKPEFMHRNFFNDVYVPNGHNLAGYTKEIEPEGKGHFAIPITSDHTADHVAKQVLPIYAAGKDVQLGMEDGLYTSDDPLDRELVALQYDKYFLTQSYTDAFMTFYNKVAERLMKAAPESQARIGFLAYANITIPPVRVKKAAKPLVAYLAQIDIDPIHGMDDPRSAPRREYKDQVYKWAEVMDGRVVIYDYDQSMLVWRDLPNPSHMMFRNDVQHYRKSGILGVSTESRGAMATTFLNLFIRGQLLWNPDTDVDAMLAEFYPKFYGPAAAAMAKYWGAIFKAWEDTIVTEHEYFVAPAIYTPELVAELRKHLEAAEQTPGAKEGMYGQRLQFTRLGFEVLDAYMAMVNAANAEVDYAAAVAQGRRGLAAREKLTEMNGTFTTYKRIGEGGYAWWPGEVQQYQELLPFVDGSKGQLIAKLPLEWAFKRDPKDSGLQQGWEKQAPDLAPWNSQKPSENEPLWKRHQANTENWAPVRSDLYLQAQGLVTEDFQSYTGHGWYAVEVELTPEQVQGPVHIRFPGLFNECWLYVNGEQAGHREFKGVWWLNDYRFEWDVDLAGKLKAGKNLLTLRINNPHHFGGMFRRPFLYKAVGQ